MDHHHQEASKSISGSSRADDDDDLPKIDPDLAQRLAALRVILPPAQAGQLGLFSREAIEQALAVVQHYKPDRNPGKYFWDALQGRWVAPAESTPAGASHDPKLSSAEEQRRRDRLADLWGLRPGLSPADLAGELRRMVDIISQSEEQQLQAYREANVPEAFALKMIAQHREIAARAPGATLQDPGLLHLVRALGVDVEVSS